MDTDNKNAGSQTFKCTEEAKRNSPRSTPVKMVQFPGFPLAHVLTRFRLRLATTCWKAELLFPRMSPREVTLTATVLGLFGGVSCLLWREHRDKKKWKKEAETLRKEIEDRKTQFLNNLQNAFLYPDWRKELFRAGEVLLDADTAHCNLILSEDRRCVTWGEKPQELPDNPERFSSLPCVLGQQHFTSGNCYWEVEVDESRAWDLGVCRDNVMRKGRVVIKPEDGFWVIRFYKDEYWVLTAPETQLALRKRTTRVCIFLEYERGCISFYDMTDHSHIHTFSQCSFSGSLRPLFRLWSSDPGQLRICPVQINTNW